MDMDECPCWVLYFIFHHSNLQSILKSKMEQCVEWRTDWNAKIGCRSLICTLIQLVEWSAVWSAAIHTPKIILDWSVDCTPNSFWIWSVDCTPKSRSAQKPCLQAAFLIIFFSQVQKVPKITNNLKKWYNTRLIGMLNKVCWPHVQIVILIN